jgi:transposase-like protein
VADGGPSPQAVIEEAIIACASIQSPFDAVLDVEALDEVFDSSLRTKRRTQPRSVTDDLSALVVARRTAGVQVKDLAREFGLHRSTVSSLLRKAGFESPVQAVQQQIDEVRSFYESGRSLAATAQHFGVSQGVITRLLERHGVPRRGTHDWHSLTV